MLDSGIIIFLAGFISSGIIRISFGTLVLREEGRWKFRLKRFDEKDEARINTWNDGFNCGLAEAAKWHDAQALNSAALIVEGRSTAANSELIKSLISKSENEIAKIIAEHDAKLADEIRDLSVATTEEEKK